MLNDERRRGERLELLKIAFNFGRGGIVCIAALALSCAPPALRIVPEPTDLDQMSSLIQGQYRERRGYVEEGLGAKKPPAELAQAYGELGLWYHAYSLKDAASTAYLNAHLLAPTEPRWLYYLGMTASTDGRGEEAKRYFLKVLDLLPSDVPTLVRLGEIELATGQVESAGTRFEQALELQPEATRAKLGLAQAKRELSDPTAALQLLELALLERPDSDLVRYALGSTLRELGEMRRAAAFLATSVPDTRQGELAMQDPFVDELRTLDLGPQSHLRRARAASQAGRHQQALANFLKAANDDSSSATAHLGVIRSLHALGRPEDALRSAMAAAELFPENARVLSVVARRLLAEGRTQEAEAQFRRALRVAPSSPAALMGLGDLLREAGDLAGASVLLSEARTVSLTARLAAASATVLIRLGRHDTARQDLEEDIRTVEGDRALTLLLARLLCTAPQASVRDGDRALSLASGAFLQTPSLDAAEVVTMARAEIGDYRGAAAGQRVILAAIERAGRQDLVPTARNRLLLFQNAQPERNSIPPEGSLGSVFVDPEAFSVFVADSS